MTSTVSIPTIDLSELDGEGKNKVTEMMKQACSELGLCQVVNHGIPVNLINQAMELCKEFFDLPYKEKIKFYTEPSDSPLPLPHGYRKHEADKSEAFFMYHPGSTTGNVIPTNPTNLRFVMEKLFTKFSETSQLLESIINDSLGLPPNFLKDYNNDRSLDSLITYRYFPATETEKNGAGSHQDPTVLGLIFQDDSGGLEVLKDGEWIPVAPIEGALVFHICDILQVLTNDKFISPSHQVVRPNGKSRYSFVFFYNLNGEKWVESLPQFTKDIGEPPKYRKFQYKDYFGVRVQEKFGRVPTKHEDKATLITFASATN